ncbi:cytochrome P450 family protein [Streptomyces liangshanensis]|uniref:cytochrome P450 family protein n=1 Tax=Streptomyces liangshanensis TaxID=2717324 RepID=UPI0036DB4A0E
MTPTMPMDPPEAGEGAVVHIDAAFKAAAPRRYAELREIGPIHRAKLSSGLDGWLVVDYHLARQALTHPALLKDPSPAADALASVGYVLNQPGVGLGGQMLEADGQEHTRLRKLVSASFTPRRAADMGPRIRSIADDLVDHLAADNSADLVESFTAPLPVTVIAELLGVPEEHRHEFRRWSSDALNPSADNRSALAGLHGLLARLVADKRTHPQDDLISGLVTVHDDEEGHLSEAELIGTCLLLIVAGHETTVNFLGNSVLALLRHPEQMRLLRGTPGLLPGAVEELLRYDTSVETATHRYAARDLELGGRILPRGSVVVVALSSAGRDAPMGEGEDSGVLDVSRPAARHMSFGHGIHHCLGAPLARLEATTALDVLLRRVPDLELAVGPEEIDWIPAGMMRGPIALPVRYGAVEPRD